MKILLLLLSTLALSSLVLAMPTTGQDKKLLEALLGERDGNLVLEQDMDPDGLALEQDVDPDLPPYQPSGEKNKDARALLQAMAQWLHFHFHWAKAQDGKGDNGDTQPTPTQEKEYLETLLRDKNNNGLALEQDMDPDLPPYRPSGEKSKDARALLQAMKRIAKNQWLHFHFHWAKAQDGKGDNGDTQPTPTQEKEYLEALLGDKNNNGLAFKQDVDPDLPPVPYQPSGDDKKGARALLQAMAQWLHFHFHWAKKQDGEDGNSAAQLQDLLTKIAKAQ